MAQVNLITTEIITAEQARAAAASVGNGEGTEANPYKIKTKADLEALRASVADGNCFEGKFFLQTTDIDMKAEPWAGIGLKPILVDGNGKEFYGDGPDPDHTFKGTYDGGGHTINNLVLAYTDGEVLDGTNEHLGFFRTCMGATIKNLTINVLGFNVPENPGNFGGAAFVGTTCDGITMINCVANGSLGTIDCPCKHTASGIIANIEAPTTVPGDATDEMKHSVGKAVLSFVTNNVNVFGCRKTGGIIGLISHDLELNNVTNNGTIRHSFEPKKRTDDGIGAIYAHGAGNNNTWRSIVKWNNVTNTGAVYSDRTAATNIIGQLVGIWSTDARSRCTGDIKFTMNDKSLPLSSNTDMGNMSAMNLFLGEMMADGFCHVVSAPKAGGEYIYLNRETGPAITLASGSIVIDQRFGQPVVKNASGSTLVGSNITGTTKYTYTAS